MADALHITEIDRSQNTPRRAARKDDSRRYIAVAGSIGAGKSSIVEFLSQQFDVQPFFEPNEANPYLEDFYQDMERWSFHSQLYFLGAKFKLHKELDASPQNVIQDRTIWEDAEIFAQNLYQQGQMSERDWRTYRNLYETVQGEIRAPDVMIYLRCPVKTVRKRIAMRGREMEKNIPTRYLNQLHTLYESWIAAYDLSPLIILPTDKLDYVTNLVDYHDIVTVVEKYL